MAVAPPAVAIRVEEPSQVGEARRAASAAACRAGLDEERSGLAALVATELASNLVKHTRGAGGEIVLSELERDGERGVELLALDAGPGMPRPLDAFRDGYSTAGTSGAGLGAIVRSGALVDVYTAPGLGTALLVRLWATPRLREPEEERVGALSLPHPAEEVCGDAWALREEAGRTLVLVADGLGHGPEAARAAGAARDVFLAAPATDLAELLARCDERLRGTRGAAVALAELDPARGVARFAGSGNVAAALLHAGERRGLVSHSGTVGHRMGRVQVFDHPFPPGALLVMHTDGLLGRWRLDRYPGLARRRPTLLAAVLYRDFRRGRDDTTVLAARSPEAAG